MGIIISSCRSMMYFAIICKGIQNATIKQADAAPMCGIRFVFMRSEMLICGSLRRSP